MKNKVFIILLLFLLSCGQNADDIYSNVTLNAVVCEWKVYIEGLERRVHIRI